MAATKMPITTTGVASVSIQHAFLPSEAPRLRRKAYSRVRPKKIEVYTTMKFAHAPNTNSKEITTKAKG